MLHSICNLVLRRPSLPLALTGLLFATGTLRAAELHIGHATVDITPDRPVALAGQFNTRISQKAETPIVAAALAIESREGDKPVDQALIITCDLVAIRDGLQDRLRMNLAGKLPGLDLKKLFLNATHTHTAPVTLELEKAPNRYEIPKEGVMQPDEYTAFLLTRLVAAAEQAWKNRAPGGVSWTLGHAVVGQNRRAVYADGRAQMYGNTNDARFRGLEGGEDHGVEMLFFWNAKQELQALAVNLACPAQEVESRKAINADFWHEAREQLRKELQVPNLTILGWISAAGDQSPHLMFRKQAEERMRKLRGLTSKEEIARRLTAAVMDTVEIARKEITTTPPFQHQVEALSLPPRRILPREKEQAQMQIMQYENMGNLNPYLLNMLEREREVVRRAEVGDKAPNYEMELHTLRLGDVAIATNPFELYLNYGIQMKSRSPALQTFLIQLACGSGQYLPTPEAIEGGSYSGLPHTNKVGPEGGQILVDRTVQSIRDMWPAPVPVGAAETDSAKKP
ncbi:hypothetical protein [Verrucomicrobium sp. BvORR106]|uniref:hypothetical protein n=1 Tax=Verrucomicrobium sp. BvORR106 TaxID=1403819 RepID=UPI0007C7BA26|nr:hypothetical protein [Verrucomicrobium sp. BvORR106]